MNSEIFNYLTNKFFFFFFFFFFFSSYRSGKWYTSGLAVDASFRALAPNPGNAADIICSSINIFLVICHLMCSKNLTVQN